MAMLCNSASITKTVSKMKTVFYLRISTWSRTKEAYVTEYKDSITYDLDNKADRAALAKVALRLLMEGSELKLYQLADRAALSDSIKDDDLF